MAHKPVISNIIVVIILSTLICPVSFGDIFYVIEGGSGTQDGTSWADANGILQEMINIASSGDQVWVAAGTYKPTVMFGGIGVKYKTFCMKNGITIYGGFAGTEPNTFDVNDRDLVTNETILSGDVGIVDYSMDDCYHVFYKTGLNSTAVLDGFTITAGNANGTYLSDESKGGGMYNYGSSPTVTNCTFRDNWARLGGGMYNYNNSPTVTNCIFNSNKVEYYGGGMYNYNESSPTVTSCTFIGNWADGGGGMWNSICSPTVTSCTFIGNWADDGGGMWNYGSSPTVTNCTFRDNWADYGSGMYNDDSSPTVTNCTFSSNSANYGGGMRNFDSDPTITNCIFWANMAFYSGNEIYNGGISYPAISYCDIAGGYTGTGNINVIPFFADSEKNDFHLLAGSPCIDTGDPNYYDPNYPIDLDGRDRYVDGDSNGTVIVDMGAYEYGPFTIYVDCDAQGLNNGTSWEDAFNYLQDAMDESVYYNEILVADGIYKPDENSDNPLGTNDRTAAFQLKNGVTIKGGYAGYGADDPNERNIHINESILSGDIGTADDSSDNSYHVVTGSVTNSTAILDGFTITCSNADGSDPDDKGGGMYNNQGSPTVTSCTFSGNSADYGGGMENFDYSDPTITNCTFSGNSAEFGGGMRNYSNSDPTITNCTFSSNSANYGGGMENFDYSDPTITNCTFSSNSANYGGGMRNFDSDPTITNCIFWANVAFYSGNEIYNGGTSYPAISYCDIETSGGSSSWDSSLGNDDGGNIDTDPLLVDADNNDLHLKSYSLCINAGDPNGSYTGQKDLDGGPRVRYGRVDMGAYEVFPIAGDFNEPDVPDEDVDLSDIAYFSQRWLNSPCTAPDYCEGADIDWMGSVDFVDFAYIAKHWLIGVY